MWETNEGWIFSKKEALLWFMDLYFNSQFRENYYFTSFIFSTHPLICSHLSYTESSFPISEVSDGSHIFTGLSGFVSHPRQEIGRGQLQSSGTFPLRRQQRLTEAPWTNSGERTPSGAREGQRICALSAVSTRLWQTLLMLSLCNRFVLVIKTEIIHQRSENACIIKQIITLLYIIGLIKISLFIFVNVTNTFP